MIANHISSGIVSSSDLHLNCIVEYDPFKEQFSSRVAIIIAILQVPNYGEVTCKLFSIRLSGRVLLCPTFSKGLRYLSSR